MSAAYPPRAAQPMILIDTALQARAAEGRPVTVALIGAGAMGRAMAMQIVHATPGMKLVAVANRTGKNARQSWLEAGITNPAEVGRLGALNDAIARGVPAVTEDASLLCEAEGIDVLIEATGAVEFGARCAMKAFACRKDFVTMNAELDATLGSILQHHARKAGVVFTLCDGDQPGVQMNLWRFVKGIGLDPLVCGNIKGMHDPSRNPATQRAFAEEWGLNPYMAASFADGSKIAFEQACVANATGMQVERRGMRGGDFDGHIDELCHNGRYDLDSLRALGGAVDYVVKARPGPGVFVFATHGDPRQRRLLEHYKLGRGPLYSFYSPYHLCHFEAPRSAARAALFRDATLAAQRPMVDTITLAKVDLCAGQVLDAIGGFLTRGECENHRVCRGQNLLPHGLAEGCRLTRPVPRDTAITRADVVVPAGRLCDTLRAEQDAMFDE